MRRRQLAYLDSAIAVALLVAASGAVLDETDVVVVPTSIKVAGGLVAAVGAFARTTFLAVQNARLDKRERELRRLHHVALDLARAVAASNPKASIDVTKVGVSIYRAVRRWPRSRRSQLKREVRFRLDDHPQPSWIDIARGKGAIGIAWQTGKAKHVNWLAVLPSGPPASQEEFDALPRGTRLDFSFEEFLEVCDKYSEILAVAIKNADGSTVEGVIKIDLARDAAKTGGGTLLDSEVVRTAASRGAVTVRELWDSAG